MQSTVCPKVNNPIPFVVRVYSAVVALLPVIASYASGIPGFSLADVILAGCCVIALLGAHTQKNVFTVRPVLICIAMYLIVFFSLLSVQFQREPEYVNIIIRTIRYFFYLTVVALCSRKLLDIAYCKKMVKTIAVLATVFIGIQYVLFAYFHVLLKGFLPFLNLYVDGYANTDYAALYQTMYRPTSFFLEPAHYARYAVLGVTLYLFDGEVLSFKEIVASIFISVGVLLSTSAQGYIFLAIIWLACLLLRIKNLKTAELKVLFYVVCLALPIILIVILRLPFVQQTVSRALNIDVSNLTNKNTAFGARLGGYSAYLDLPFLHKLIGMGFGVVPKGRWLSSAAYWLYGSGCVVFVLYVVYGIMCLVSARGVSRMILLLFLILFFSDDSFYSYICVLYISLSCLKLAEPVGRNTV